MNARCFVALAALALAACGADKAPQAEVPPVVLTRTVHFGPSAPVAGYSGEVHARYDTDLAFRLGGKIAERTAEVGASVKRGAVLARLDPADVGLAAQAARAQTAAAETEHRYAEAELDRSRSLRARNYISQAALDARVAAFDAARERLAQARAQAAVAGNQAGYAALAADYDGVVTAVLAEPGQVVAAGQPVLRLARTREREVWISIPESRVDDFKSAASLTMVLLAEPDHSYRAVLRELSPSADSATRTFTAKLALPAADERVRLGMTASVLVAGHAGATVARLPLAAVSGRDDQAVLWVVEDSGVLRPQPVKVEAYGQDYALVQGGVADGARIVVAGVHRLAAGLKVRAVEAGSRPR